MTTANATSPSSPAPIDDAEGETLVHLDRRAQFLTLGAVMLGMLLGSLDQTIVGTAMPKIVADLNGLQRYTWVITGYLVASTTMMPIFGKVSDIFGRKWLYMLGIVVFLGGSMLSGIAQSMEQLIAFRVLQGAGAGMMLPIAQAIIGDIFTPAERGKYQGLLGAVFGWPSSSAPGSAAGSPTTRRGAGSSTSTFRSPSPPSRLSSWSSPTRPRSTSATRSTGPVRSH